MAITAERNRTCARLPLLHCRLFSRNNTLFHMNILKCFWCTLFKHTSCFPGTPLVGQFQECSLGFKRNITCMCFWYTICNINYKSRTRLQTYREWPQVRGSAWWTRSCCGVRGQTWHFRNLPPSLRCSSPYALLSSEPENKIHQNKRVILRKEVKKIK